MKHLKFLILSLFYIIFMFIQQACDSGDIYPETEDNASGRSVSASYLFSNAGAFPENYKIVFATFSSSSSYPVSSTQISESNISNNSCNVSLSNVTDDAETVGLYLVQQYGSKKIHTFSESYISSFEEGNIEMGSCSVELASFSRIQNQVFSQCIQCHGGSEYAAAGLYLTEGLSYSNLVEVQSINNSSKMRVMPGSFINSFIVDLLSDESGLRYNHSDLSTLNNDDLELIKTWISSGALNN